MKVTRNLNGSNCLRGVLLVCTLFAICSARTARAQTTWNYSGQAFSSCYGTYSTTGITAYNTPCDAKYNVSVSLTIPGSFSSGWNAYSSDNYSVTDGLNGVVTLTQTNSNGGDCDGCIELFYNSATNTITQWDIYLACSSAASCNLAGPYGAVSFADIDTTNCVNCPDSYDDGVYDYSDYYSEESEAQGGGYFSPSPTPEPSSLLLYGSGLLAIGGIVLRRKRIV